MTIGKILNRIAHLTPGDSFTCWKTDIPYSTLALATRLASVGSGECCSFATHADNRDMWLIEFCKGDSK